MKIFIGRSVPRLEDRPLLTGQGRFAADISFPGQLHMRVVRSPHRARQHRGDRYAAALALPGVHAVWTHADVAHIPPIGFRLTGLTELEPYRQPSGTGPCAMSASRSPRYSPTIRTSPRTPPIWSQLDIEPLAVASMPPHAPGEFDDRTAIPKPTIIEKKSGDIEAAFRAAHAIVELDLAIGRHTGVPLETRGAIARYDAARDVLEMHGAAKVPHWNRDRSRGCSAARPTAFTSTKATSAAASASAARSIPRTCWSAPRRCASTGRSNGSRTGASI